MPNFMSIFITIIVGALGFLIGVLVTNAEWTRKVDDISKKLLDRTEEELIKIYEKDKVRRKR